MPRRKLEVGTKDAVLADIDSKAGSVAEVAKKHNVHVVTAYRWLRERKAASVVAEQSAETVA